MTVTYTEYSEDRKNFFSKHNNDFSVETSSMDEYGRYWKTYNFEDGAQWFEAMCPTYEQADVEIKKVLVHVQVKMLRTEYWNTEAGSKCYYEKF